MARPKALEKIELIPGKTIISTEEFQAAFKGKIDDKGRVPTVGNEFAGCEVYVFIKK